jgi:DNA repair exonuclease SbcCD nuclease subunit
MTCAKEPIEQERLTSTQVAVKKLNIMYLSLLREVAQRDVKEAVVRFGVEQSVAERIASLDVEQVISQADCSILQFKMRAPIAMRQAFKQDVDEMRRVAAIASMISDLKPIS